jgi:hypothetical protein
LACVVRRFLSVHVLRPAVAATPEETPMSYPYPQDRSRDRQEKGDQPYQDAREAMAQSEARLQGEAEAEGEARRDETEEERQARVAAELQDRLREVNDDVAGRQR